MSDGVQATSVERDERAPARRPKSNVRTAVVLAFVAAAFYFGMIFLGPLSR